jgi:hypothetical protein
MQAIQKCQNYEIWRRISDAIAENSDSRMSLSSIFVIYAKVSGISEKFPLFTVCI